MKRPTINTQRAKKEISIVQYLANHGYHPVGKSGKRLQYKSPFRDEKAPSMFVDDAEGLWNDFGHGGGSIIDLAIQIHQEIQTVQEALEHLAEYTHEPGIKRQPSLKKRKANTADKISPISNLQIRPLNHFVLLKYLRAERGIGETIAKKHLYLLFYDNKNKRGLFGLGWQNDSGAWEIRSAGQSDFKAVTGPKDITTIPTSLQSKKYYIFEGMLDYLSALILKKSNTLNGKVFILNSTSMIKKVIGILKKESPEVIYTFFDNDKSGRKAIEKLQASINPKLIQAQTFYQDFNDVNEYLVQTLKSKQ